MADIPADTLAWMEQCVQVRQLETKLLAGLPCRIDRALLMRAAQPDWVSNPYVCPLIYSCNEEPGHARAVVTDAVTNIPALHAAPYPIAAPDMHAGLTPMVLRFALAQLDAEYLPLRALDIGNRKSSHEPPQWCRSIALEAIGRVLLQPEARARYRVGEGFPADRAGASNGGTRNIQKELDRLRHLLRQRIPCLASAPALQELLQAVAGGLALALLEAQLGEQLNRARIERWIPERYRLLPATDFLQKSAPSSTLKFPPKISKLPQTGPRMLPAP